MYAHQRVGAQSGRLCSASLATGSIIPAVPQKFPMQQRRSVQATRTCLSVRRTTSKPAYPDFKPTDVASFLCPHASQNNSPLL